MKNIVYLLVLITTASCTTTNLLVQSKSEMQESKNYLDSAFVNNPSYEYRIRKNDKISISVWGQDQLSVGSVYGIYNSNEVYGKWLMVDAYGQISLPKIGPMYVENMTVPLLKDTLKTVFSHTILFPIIDVKVLNKEITVMGEVRNPQVFTVDKDKNSLLELIAKSGGLEFYANARSVKVLRQEGENVRVTNIDLTKAGDYNCKNINLLPGDIVIVPSKKNKEFDKRISTIIPFATAITAAALLIKIF